MELPILMDRPTLTRMVDTSAAALDEKQLEEIYMFIDDDAFQRASRCAEIDIFSDDSVEAESKADEVYEDQIDSEPAPSKIRFFTALLLGLSAAKHFGEKSHHKHDGKCNGDCANCPPHYGYRYGRWYYGHHHDLAVSLEVMEGCSLAVKGSLDSK